jgi:PAS domain S-box-containing protein
MATTPEYVLEPIRVSAEFTLYRTRRRGNPMPLLAVAPTIDPPPPQSLRRLEHEYSLASELEPAWAAKPLALTRQEGRTILVLADAGGEPLNRILEQCKEQPLDLAHFLRLATNLATALGHAHQRGLIHKDIKPENVLVDDSGHVWLTGFGIASRLPRGREAPAALEFIVGSLAYISPEQTGRMNRSLDTRSDLYSLGVTLYQMLTGVLPFAAADPLEWVHCHIARQPVAPADRREVPEPLSAIIMRLLAKNAEERYQTAAGLEADLRRCLAEWQSHGRIDPFPLGTHDSSDRLLIPEKLYGREREVDALLATFDRVVAQGDAELVLVSGYSGVGKSSVVNELHKVLVPPRGLFAAGKFDQYKRDVPYATLAQAFQMLVRQILVKSEAEVDHWRQVLLEALGPNGQLMVNLIPEVEFVIGKQPPVAELSPQQERGRFQLVFRRFLGAFARPEHPLALFLDDLQWLDTATLELLERLVTDPDVRHVLLIGAYRDNEVSSSHPLMRTLGAIRDAGARAQEIVLAPLGLNDVERLVADALQCGPNSAGPLALLIHEKTGGNPFFAIQLLTALVQEGLVQFDRGAAGWIWDLDRIRAKGYSENVVDLMLGKLRRLPNHTQSALQHLACLGNVAEIELLSLGFGQSEEEIHAPLWDAVRTGLIVRLNGSYAFLHDRIQEAAYTLIPEAQRAEVHLRIARLLMAQTPPEEREETVFEIVNQFNRAAELITSETERHQLAELNLVAGERAKASTAYASALQYFIAGEALLTNDCWERRHDLIFRLELHRAECEFLTGEVTTTAERLEALRSRALNAVELAMATCLGIDVALVICRAVSLSLERGNSDGSCLIYVWISNIAGHRLSDYKNAVRFAQLGYDLVEKHSLKRFQAGTYHTFAAMIMPWMKHPRVCCGVIRQAFEIANKIGDLPYAVYSRMGLISLLIAAGDPLVAVQSEAQSGLFFAQKAKFGFGVDTINMLLGFIRTLRGSTASFGSFNHAEFDEIDFERNINNHPSMAQFWYWVRKLQVHFFAGDFASAIEASLKARPLLLVSPTVEMADYQIYSALARAACCDSATGAQSREHFEALGTHYERLQVWTEHCAENFENGAALVGAEIARIQGRDVEAEQLYERAIRSARANGFVHNEAVAYEVAARFYAARGLETVADAYLRNARNCYDRWGASGKVRQLEAQYPRLRAQAASSSLTATIVPPAGQLDVETVVKGSQALSSEIVLPRLIEKLVRIAVENAGAERGLLILLGGGDPRIEAEATTGPAGIEVTVRQQAVGPSDLPQSALHYVIRTQESVLLDDASADSVYSKDDYVRQKRSKSVLCLPIVNHAKLIGALYLENNLTACAFTPDRLTVLQLLASQAAISLENAGLYFDLRREGQNFRLIVDSVPGFLVTMTPRGEVEFGNQGILDYTGWTLEQLADWRPLLHSDECEMVATRWMHSIETGDPYDVEHRILGTDGVYRWFLVRGLPARDAEGCIVRWYILITDIDERIRTHEKLRQSEKEARQLLDLSPLHITEFAPDGARLYTNRASLNYYGITLEEWRNAGLQQVLHPQDARLVSNELPARFQSGSPFEYEVRLKRKDGQYRWFHYRLSPMSDEQGRITRWYAAGTDIDDRKLAEQKLQEENVALREEVDKASMFEEIVGTSAPLKKVLSRISKVAPTESSVLITGETGTGKELVARAIHRRSRRSSHPFVSVNCAVIPRDLIASELFGHEKGAFTGATQRRVGRFELAEKGTIFLDEVGELPAETQIALLRVLQEREFERIGGIGTIRADVRVIAATNRDLESAIESGKFRSDLFYRLNVFPVELPPLRKRSEDIPLLVTYFLNRYARKAGRHFTSVDKKSLDLLESYAWPGNIRELQNVIERSIIVSESQTFSVDESWLSRRPSSSDVGVQPSLFNRLPGADKALIEAALRECGGRVYGPSGAAAKLGMPRTTLESKIKSFKINKNRFKGPDPVKDS